MKKTRCGLVSQILRLFVSALLMFLSACAFGTNMSLQDANVKLRGAEGVSAVVVAVDKRPYVVSGDKTPEWVGLQRSGYGIPYGVHTTSGEPLAEEFSKAICSVVQSSGGRAEASSVEVGGDAYARARSLMARTGYSRALVLEIAQWKSDTYTNVHFEHDLVVKVLDRRGTVLAQSVSKDDEKLDGSFWNPVGASERSVKQKEEQVLDKLLNDAKIRQALRSH